MINLRTGSHFRDLTKKEEMLTRRNVLTGLGGIIAAGCAPSIALGAARIVSRDTLAGSANASVGGMMRNVGARYAAMFGGKSMPYDREVEWLIFDSSKQYIRTGVNGNLNTRIVAVGCFADTYTVYQQFTPFVHAQTSSSSRISMYLGHNLNETWTNQRFGANEGSGDIDYRNSLTKYDFSKDWLKIDDVPTSGFKVRTSQFNAGEFWLFQNPQVSGLNLGKGKVASVQIYNSGVLERDFITVRIGSNGCVYDRRGIGGINSDGTSRNDGLYFNQGTGNFEVGPDK